MRKTSLHGVDLIDYDRPGLGVLFSSGCGIGLGLMDACPSLRWFCDVDNYRKKLVDWEAVAVTVSLERPSVIVLAGWFTIDVPTAFNAFCRGVVEPVKVITYTGGRDVLAELISEINAL